MTISVPFDETDLYQFLDNCITHPNKESFIRLLVPMIADSHQASSLFISAYLGKEIPKPMEEGTLCYIDIENLGYSVDKTLLTKNNTVTSIPCKISKFRGYHNYSNYDIEFNYPDGRKEICSVERRHLKIIVDF